MRTIPINGRLAAYFSDDQIKADMVKASYEAAERVLMNPENFPKADRDTLAWLTGALWALSPTACIEGR